MDSDSEQTAPSGSIGKSRSDAKDASMPTVSSNKISTTCETDGDLDKSENIISDADSLNESDEEEESEEEKAKEEKQKEEVFFVLF
jgi:hypothetical protein